MDHWIKKSFILLIARSSILRAGRESCSSINTQHHFLLSASYSSQQPSYCNINILRRNYLQRQYTQKSFESMISHVKARCPIYPRCDLKRGEVPDDKVSWDVDFPDYAPVEFTSPSVSSQPVWADTPDASTITSFNEVDQEMNVDRRSYMGKYKIVNGRPRNPIGRTGITGRGHLGRWGPNHAGDPIVTRWKRDSKGNIVKAADGKKILQFVSVQRRDNHEWALPGGMVNPGENRTAALIREFGEEALNTLEATDEEKEEINKHMMENFKDGHKIYTGYVDDPRNTDNAWMETKVLIFHDEVGNGLGAFKLNAGDDAMGVQWMDIDSSVKLYASHKDFIKATVDHLRAHW